MPPDKGAARAPSRNAQHLDTGAASARFPRLMTRRSGRPGKKQKKKRRERTLVGDGLSGRADEYPHQAGCVATARAILKRSSTVEGLAKTTTKFKTPFVKVARRVTVSSTKPKVAN